MGQVLEYAREGRATETNLEPSSGNVTQQTGYFGGSDAYSDPTRHQVWRFMRHSSTHIHRFYCTCTYALHDAAVSVEQDTKAVPQSS